MRKPTDEMLHELYEAILSRKNESELSDLFEDLCTRKEVEQMAGRLYAARLLAEGAGYAATIEESGLSSATVSRVSRCLQYGEGYRSVLGIAQAEAEEAESSVNCKNMV